MADGPLLNQRWHLGERLGSGAQGHTYLAHETGSDRIVVLKQLHLGKGSGTSWKKFDLFEREVRVLRELDHPCIPKLLDHFESEPGVFNLVMERAAGRPLSAEGLELDEADLRTILRDVLEVLRYLHSRKPPVVHRDLKPANIVRANDGAISIVDFGGVRAAVRETGGSTVVGTFGYMAPEQLHGQATAATDLYGLGATIVALAGGVEPERVPRKGLRMDLRAHLPTLDRELVRVLEWMTEPDPDERPQSAEAVLERLGPEADKAMATIEPARVSLKAEAGAVERSTVEFIDSLPKPVAILMRVLLFMIGMTGYLGFTVVRVALIPLFFGLIGAFSSDKSKPSLRKSRKTVNIAIDDCRDGFKIITGMSRKRSRQLSAGDDEAPGADADRDAYRR